MTAYDFFAPIVIASLTNEAGDTVVPLWFGERIPADVLLSKFNYRGTLDGGRFTRNLAILTEAQVEMNLGSFYTIQLTLSPPYDDAIAFMNSDLMTYPATFIRLRFGYIVDGVPVTNSPELIGELKEPDFSLGQEITLTLKANAAFCSSLAKTTNSRRFVNQTRSDIVALLLAGGGTPARPISLNFERMQRGIDDENRAPSEERKRLDTPISYEQGGKSDLAAVKEILDQCLCSFYMRNDAQSPQVGAMEAVILDRNARFGADSAKEFRLFSNGQFSGEMYGKGVYPITSVSTQTKAIFLRNTLKGVVQPQVDDKTKQSKVDVKNLNTHATLKTKPVGPTGSPGGKVAYAPKDSKASPGLDKKTGLGGDVVFGDKNLGTQQSKIDGQSVNKSLDGGIKLSVESLGIPDLEPGQIVVVRGLGGRVDGKYSLLKVTHVIGASGFVTRWEGIQNAGYLSQTMNAATLSNNPVKGTNTVTDSKNPRIKVEAGEG